MSVAWMFCRAAGWLEGCAAETTNSGDADARAYGNLRCRPCRLAADAGHLHLLQPDRRRGADFGVAVVACAPDGADGGGELLVGRAAAQEPAEVVPAGGEEARVKLAIRAQARTGAGAAERLGHGGDDADLSPAVGVHPALGHLAEVVA